MKSGFEKSILPIVFGAVIWLASLGSALCQRGPMTSPEDTSGLAEVEAMTDTSGLRGIAVRHMGKRIGARAQNRIGEILYAKKRYGEAEKEYLSTYRQYLGKSPERMSAAYHLGKTSFQRERPADARRYLGEFLASNPKGHEADWARYYLVRTKFRAGDKDYVRAVKSYFATRHDATASHDPTVQYDLIRYLMDHHKYADALAEAKTMTKKYPDDKLTLGVRFKLGIIYEMVERHEDAVENYRSIIRTAKSSAIAAHAQFELAGAYDCRNDFGNARREYAKVPLLYPDVKHYVDAAECSAAMMLYRESLMNPDSSDLGEKAMGAVRKFVTDHPTDRHTPRALMALADMSVRHGDYKAACKFYDEIIAFDSTLVLIKPKAAIRSNDAVAHRELVMHAHLSKGDILHDNLQESEQALAEYRSVLTGDPGNGVVQLKEAVCLIDMGQKEEARDVLNGLVRGNGPQKESATYLLQRISADSTSGGNGGK